MRKFLIYGAGLIVITFVVGLLLFLTFENAASSRAIFGNRLGSLTVHGPASILVNIGITGIVCSLISFIGYLINRNALLLKSYKFIGAASGVFIFIGLAWGQA